ncbi:MAG: hypothetical protein ACLSHW_10375 [Lachnospiraceae bacterium]
MKMESSWNLLSPGIQLVWKEIINTNFLLEPMNTDCILKKDGIDFGGGEFSVEKDTSKITLRCIEMHGIVQSNYRDQMTAKVSHQDGRVFIPSSEDSYNFYLPCYDGDSYYNFELVPNDTENYVTQRGHFYNYAVGGAFKQLNLSDQHYYRLMKKHEFVAKYRRELKSVIHRSQDFTWREIMKIWRN